jgi:hypothetical protein
LRAYVQQESGRPEETEHIELEVRTKRTKWDCESIATTYSNIYNHPTVIREAPKRKINPNKKKAKEQPMEVEGEVSLLLIIELSVLKWVEELRLLKLCCV